MTRLAIRRRSSSYGFGAPTHGLGTTMSRRSPVWALSGEPERLALKFLARVWTPPHEIDAIDELLTEDYQIISAGVAIRGRAQFKEWVKAFHELLPDARVIIQDLFCDADGDKAVCRWCCTGRNNGLFGLPADGRTISFTGIAIWKVRDGQLARCWVERSGLEVYQQLTGMSPVTSPDLD